MWTNRVLMCGIDILLCLWAVYLFFFYFDIFFARKRKRYLSVIGITLFVIWQFGITTIISFPAYINIAVTIMFTFLAVMMTYEGRWWNKGVFVITFNAIWMLMETLCNYILLTYCPQYAAVRQVGSFVSKIFFNAVILALKKEEIIERERAFAAIIKIKGSLGHLTPILAISEGGSIQDIFSILKAGAYDYIETIDNTRKYKKKIENLILWNWYIKKHTSAKKRQC